MGAVDGVEDLIERSHLALGELVNGNPEPLKEIYSHRQDVSLANPFGPPARGWHEVAEAQERGAAVFRDGEIYDFETVAKYATPELACILWIERTNAKVGGQRRSPRATFGSRWPFGPKMAPGRWSTATRTP